MYKTGQAIAPEDIPESIAKRVSAKAPKPARLMLAKALLPMPPEDLGLALGVLARDTDAEIAEAALASLQDLPPNVLTSIAAAKFPAAVLDVLAHSFRKNVALLQALLRNESCADDTVRWMASELKGAIIPLIAANQRRYLRYPPIIAALIQNPAAPTPVLAPVVETALRNGVETSRIPGFKELAQAFFKDIEQIRQQPPEQPAEEAPMEAPLTTTAVIEKGIDEREMTRIAEEALERDAQQQVEEDDDAQDSITAEVEEEEEEPEEEHKALWKLVQEMSVPQKVRLAVMGDASARALLIRDSKATVAMAVMKSPRLTDREIAMFAQNKSINEEVIRMIARQRDWTKNYTIRLALVKNPKCPPTQALTFLRSLQKRDVQRLAKAKDVPAYVRRAAKTALERKSGRF